MILCVTLNPCLDKTLTVPPWSPGETVRGTSLREVVGGKGNNVARALARLGRPARPAMFLGGPVGDRCEVLLRRDDGFDPLVSPTAAPTRVILTVRTEETSEQTAFFDPDPDVTAEEARDLYHRVEGALLAEEVRALTLSGSSPSRATHGVYSDLIGLARSRRVPVLLDTYGPALKAVWGFWPDILQLNRREAAAHLGRSDLSDADVLSLLGRWARHGVSLAVVTDGPRPALALARGLAFAAHPPTLNVVNPIGSGDCLLAGLADARLDGLDPEASLRRGMACAAANALVWDAGAIDPDEVRFLEPSIRLEPITLEPSRAFTGAPGGRTEGGSTTASRQSRSP